jgi:hypothetical protein
MFEVIKMTEIITKVALKSFWNLELRKNYFKLWNIIIININDVNKETEGNVFWKGYLFSRMKKIVFKMCEKLSYGLSVQLFTHISCTHPRGRNVSMHASVLQYINI